MKKILLFLILLFGLLGCGEKKPKYEPSILLGSHYMSVIEEWGKPDNKDYTSGLKYRIIDEKSHDYEFYFSRDMGYYYNEDGNSDDDRIDLIDIIPNKKILKGGKFFFVDENKALSLVNSLFLNKSADFKLIRRTKYPEYERVIYESENLGNLKDVAKIIVFIDIKDGIVDFIELTSCNYEPMYQQIVNPS